MTIIDFQNRVAPMEERHVCTSMCHIESVFGNLFVCRSSGEYHVCDQNCNQRIPYDRYTMICRLSKRLFPVQEEGTFDQGESRFVDKFKRPLQRGVIARDSTADWFLIFFKCRKRYVDDGMPGGWLVERTESKKSKDGLYQM